MEKLHEFEIVPPPVITAVCCRLRGDIEYGIMHSIPVGELNLMLDIIESALLCVKEWEPTEWEKHKGHGTGVGMRSAEDRLIRCIRRDI